MSKVRARRIKSDLIRDLEKPGDYLVKYVGDEIECVWFAIPGYQGERDNLQLNRITGPASPEHTRWGITEGKTGAITVQESIRCQWNEGDTHFNFHAWLKSGVWELLPDSRGFAL